MNEYERRLQRFTRESCEKEFSARVPGAMGSGTHTPSPGPVLANDHQKNNLLSSATVDVFTSTVFQGNQLAVVQISKDFHVPKDTKQSIAREFNFSETVFVSEPKVAGQPWDLAIFTVDKELPFAGHPVIGAAYYICEHLEPGTGEISLSCKAGLIPVRYDREAKLAEVVVPTSVRIHQQAVSGRAVLKNQPCLARTAVFNSSLPVVSIVKGMTFVLIHLPTVASHMEKLEVGPLSVDTSSVLLDSGWTPSFVGCYFYTIVPVSRSPTELVARLRTRMFGSAILEDSATGSAACTLSVYLAVKDGTPSGTYKYIIEQGVEMGRASEINVRVELDSHGKDVKNVSLSGRAVLVTQGTLHLPNRK